MTEYIKREDVLRILSSKNAAWDAYQKVELLPATDVVELPETGIGDLSDGYHTFNGLYYQRMILFAALVKAYKDRAWKSYRHEDGEYCFGGGWFIVGIDTPQGSYTYHYEDTYWNWFECDELPVAKHWDGHTEQDVVRLCSLPDVVERKKGKWKLSEFQNKEDIDNDNYQYECSCCGHGDIHAKSATVPYCWFCGAEMEEESDGNT